MRALRERIGLGDGAQAARRDIAHNHILDIAPTAFGLAGGRKGQFNKSDIRQKQQPLRPNLKTRQIPVLGAVDRRALLLLDGLEQVDRHLVEGNHLYFPTSGDAGVII
ncbi:gll3028 [Gloeobacter violaceus PCC 7421]|uniref:Gll3028 protein n=1 Tax=Gloeobacter violaceus (strain ATCC 29082 / PCC 7421) TaxID=251221 RepID=Q7NCF1_GLOVI|nr:gll3028 [Gloeobacter violaceus PCC 7421]